MMEGDDTLKVSTEKMTVNSGGIGHFVTASTWEAWIKLP